MEGNKILVVRNYINEDVIDKTPINWFPVLKIYGENGLYGKKLLEKLFFEDSLQEKYDYLILVDEDCFVYCDEYISKLVDYMENNHFEICGMPDGGTSRIRNHRNDVPNLFFTIFDCRKIRNINKEGYMKYQVPTELYQNTDTVHCDDFEGYYKMLCYLRYKLNMTFLPLTDVFENEERATVVSFNNKKLCIHCWYSRKYQTDNEVKERINKILDNSQKVTYE